MNTVRRFRVDRTVNERLDRWLAALAPDLSRTRWQALLEQGCVTAEGRPLMARDRPCAGTELRVEIPHPESVAVTPQPIPLDVLFEDSDLIVINKPAGLVVHPAPGHAGGTLVNALLHRCPDLAGIGGQKRPGIVHRLDKDTSGVLVAAKTQRAMTGLVALFKSGQIRKEYACFVWGRPRAPSGVIETLIERSAQDRKRMTTRTGRGRRAVSRYRVERAFRQDAVCLLRVGIDTGRTHQIRVHMKHLGHPVVGDPVYGLRQPPALPFAVPSRQLLHAARLAFVHPVTGRHMDCRAPWPRDMVEFCSMLNREEP